MLKAYYTNNKSHFKSCKNVKTDSSFTIVSKLFFSCKNFYFVNNEVTVGCPKLGETTRSMSSFYVQLILITCKGKDYLNCQISAENVIEIKIDPFCL